MGEYIEMEIHPTGNPVSPTNKTDRHDITKILLKVVLNAITQAPIQK
jgi:cobalamin-dependent methionine synthase I